MSENSDEEPQTPDTNARGTRKCSKMQMQPKLHSRLNCKHLTRSEEAPTEDSESDFIDDSIREQSDDDQDPIVEFLVEYQEETQKEIQEIQLEEGMPQDTENKNLCKHRQDAETFLVTPTKGMA
ncbi:hypothetical protein O181_011870 [Austropuccinia psidii MF-1]|uniref:Uncharacterized protein n=1 Tax=Austropuccinia psidii MF-1 TaxID=1389203 RepID=A0A9Q3BWR7_9BASI|nr:hypothetical protein [Austropuccinia psidii MF-1]